MSSVDVSVVVVNHNTRELLHGCLTSVLEDARRSGLKVEVIVVDNASTDGSPEWVAQHFPDVLLLRTQQNLGYSAGNNLGIRRSRGRNVLLLNSDTVLRPGALREMCAKLDARADLGAVAPKLLNPDGSVQQSCWRFPLKALLINALGLGRLGLVDDYRRWDHRTDREVEWVCSAAVMVPRRAFERVGLLDEDFFYGADTDWCHRAARAGLRFLSLSRAEVVHHGRGSRTGPLDPRFVGGPPVQEKYVHKHYGKMGVLLFRLLLLLNALPRAVILELLHRLRPGSALRERRELYRRLLSFALRKEGILA
ncbi:MAG: glycosyltransferase family 2 protein [Armatimonadota bacterium]|nr:glycosyltransferase family 2 protein [Armatimonadota bacterium]MDR7443532.1 glycosyltransferase family 2 protein [Armatimonadota bacterium]MDR7570365.1 glycosyltransferase family 2 protein [Armatimonadota bacterium]MDR7615031.1 glycosyltransferase family 2 protein [Armatimonadota bacterium]